MVDAEQGYDSGDEGRVGYDSDDEGLFEPGGLRVVVPVAAEDPLVPEGFRIQDMQQYLQLHGLQDRAVGSLSEQNMTEARQRVQDASTYQETVHKKFFREEEQANPDRRCFLDSIEQTETIDIPTSTDVIREVPLKPLAKACDTLLTFLSFRQTQQREKQTRMSFALDSFQHESVVEFVGIVLGDLSSENVSADCVVECCEIARYMQCPTVLDQMVEILIRSIDHANCMSLCQLADRLDLPVLFETSMAKAMRSIGDLQYLEVWNDFNPELKSRIITIESLIKSSILTNGSRLYFASLDEYLAIFAENVQYYRERLDEAKERQSESLSKGDAWKDAQKKICKQEKRMLTLETVLKEQKEIFSINGDVCHIRASQPNRSS
jgi:hypothetical protein